MATADRSWAELVLHVLAHLEPTAQLPSSLYNAAYVRASCAALGPTTSRSLGADIPILSVRLTDHEQLTKVQCLARLHPSLDSAEQAAGLDLASLSSTEHADLAVAEYLVAECHVTAELLRAAALLEAAYWRGWSHAGLESLEQRLASVLHDFWSVAPRLRRMAVKMLRPLGLRGRAWPDQVWVGVPDQETNDGPSFEHVLWQAAHEATVVEVAERASAERRVLTERGVERVAVALLALRATYRDRAHEHAQWLQHLTLEARSWTSLEGVPQDLRDWFGEFSVT